MMFMLAAGTGYLLVGLAFAAGWVLWLREGRRIAAAMVASWIARAHAATGWQRWGCIGWRRQRLLDGSGRDRAVLGTFLPLAI